MILDFRFLERRVLKFIGMLLLVMHGCTSAEDKHTIHIFDFQKFFKEQAGILNASAMRVNKTITDKENVYTTNEMVTDWQKELEMFSRLSVIKPEQESMYTIDTLRSDRGFTYLVYTSENPRLKLQNAEVMLNPDQKVEKVTLIIHSEEKINNSDITLTYLPMKGYDIKGDINSVIAGDKMLDIHVECVN